MEKTEETKSFRLSRRTQSAKRSLVAFGGTSGRLSDFATSTTSKNHKLGRVDMQ